MTEPYANIRQALAKCRDIAMEWTMRGRIPECGKFGEIAQDLDAVCAELEIMDSERDQLAAALEAAREDAERYRWLRDALMGNSNAPLDAFTDQPEPDTTADFDAAIDQARGNGVKDEA